MTPQQKFLDFVFADKTDDETICVAKGSPKPDGQTLFWNVSPEHEVFTKWAAIADRSKQAWYFCVSTVSGTLNDKGTALRRRRVDLVRYHCLVLDDIGTKAEAPPVAPGWVMETSAGNTQWGYLLQPGDDWESYEALLEWCHDQGWGDEGAGGSYRVMRVSGSCNLKPGRDNFHSDVIYRDDIVWTLEELASELGCALDDLPKKSLSVPEPLAGGVSAREGIDPLLRWLGLANEVVADDGGEWIKVLCPWADRHTIETENTAGYSPLGRGEGEWVKRRAFKCLHAHCKAEGFNTYMKLMAERGAPWVSGVDPLPWYQAKFTYIGMGKRVADLSQRPLGGRWMWELGDWGKMHKGRIRVPGRDAPVEMETAFLEHEDTVKVVDTQYWPVRADEDVAVISQRGQKLVNTYVPPSHAVTDVAPDVFLDHVDYLLPVGDEADLFLDWLAFLVQEPASRSYAILMIAEDTFGVGRSWLKSMMTLVLQGKVQTATLSQLIGKGTSAEQTYNDWMCGCQLLVVEEAKDNLAPEDFFHGYETFKQRVDTRVMPVRVNPKFGRTRDDFMFFSALIFSNHSDALAIPDNDRRLCVLTNPKTLQSVEYYDALNAALDGDEPGAVYWYLMRRDLSSFDHVYPPMTPGKLKMVDQHRSPAAEIMDYICAGSASDIVTKPMLKKLIVGAAHALEYPKIMSEPGAVLRMIWGKIGSLRPGEKNGARYFIKEKQVEIRALKASERWLERDDIRDLDSFIREMEKSSVSENVIDFDKGKKK